MAELKHIGTPRRSGRYPWGSGDTPYQRNAPFRAHVEELRKQGMSDEQIWTGMKMKSSEFRAKISLDRAAQVKEDTAFATRLKDKGYSNVEIGKRMGINESSVRNLLDPVFQERALVLERSMNMLKKQVAEKQYLDVGAGVENHIGISRTKLDTAIIGLKDQGYKLQYVTTYQPGTGKKTTIKVLTKDDVQYTDLYKNKDKIRTITDWSEDGGRSFLGLEPVTNISPNRISVKYKEDGGADMDGVIQIRRGTQDLSLGDSHYAQVRIGVDGTHYIKGMAIYSDNMPDGVDIVFNTNKPKGTPVLGKKDNTVLKVNEKDEDNPFGAIVRQKHYVDSNGQDKLSALNIVNEEGSWLEWSKTLSSQMLSKQPPALAKQQLDLDYKIRKEEFDEYQSLTNPTVKRKLLETYADDCDSAAVHLKAAAMPRQATHVILPAPQMKPNEIYAPNYNDDDIVVLIRHPHGGIFEIPQLTVNNKNPEMKSILGNAKDGVAIHPDVAKKLSGADFDGDTVLVIPNKAGQIKVAPSLKGLSDFDPKASYPKYQGMKPVSVQTKETEMGKISNLITDMTIQGASHDEIARAVRHSMVVIDSEKHQLDYKRSAIDNKISELKTIYQGGPTKGSATLISRASSEIRITPKRKDGYKVDPKTGAKIFEAIPETYINKKGEVIQNRTYMTKDKLTVNKNGETVIKPGHLAERTTKSTRMYETEDAFTLSSGTRMEAIYANYANSLKKLGNDARLSALKTPLLEYSPSARKTYAPQVESLLAQLSVAVSNKPIERQALLLTNKVVSAKKESNPNLTPKELKKIKGQALAESRTRVGAKKQSIKITPIEWEAIQAGAISDHTLSQILNNTDLTVVKQYATPRSKKGISTAKLSRARLMLARGYPQSEVADMIGVSATALMNAITPTQEGGG